MVKTASHARVARRPVHGVILLDKPIGFSSNQALQKVKWLLRATKAGHTGTLDPLATGVLPLCFGAATKFAQIHLDANKRYKATVRLGATTSTGDSEGEVLEQREVNVTAEQLQAVLQRFKGKISQIPPMHSALKHEGKALYEYARAGIEIERKAREVSIFELQASMLDAQTFEMDVMCSKGTYIRTLAADIGEALGCGAYLLGLQRTGSGNAVLTQCVTLEALEAMSEPERMAQLKPPAFLLENLPVIALENEDAGRFLTGMRRVVSMSDAAMVQVMGKIPDKVPAKIEDQLDQVKPENPEEQEMRVMEERSTHNVLLGVAHVQSGELIPDRLLSPIEIQEWIEQNHINEQVKCNE